MSPPLQLWVVAYDVSWMIKDQHSHYTGYPIMKLQKSLWQVLNKSFYNKDCCCLCGFIPRSSTVKFLEGEDPVYLISSSICRSVGILNICLAESVIPAYGPGQKVQVQNAFLGPFPCFSTKIIDIIPMNWQICTRHFSLFLHTKSMTVRRLGIAARPKGGTHNHDHLVAITMLLIVEND